MKKPPRPPLNGACFWLRFAGSRSGSGRAIGFSTPATSGPLPVHDFGFSVEGYCVVSSQLADLNVLDSFRRDLYRVLIRRERARPFPAWLAGDEI
jgi:hypothetical protein